MKHAVAAALRRAAPALVVLVAIAAMALLWNWGSDVYFRLRAAAGGRAGGGGGREGGEGGGGGAARGRGGQGERGAGRVGARSARGGEGFGRAGTAGGRKESRPRTEGGLRWRSNASAYGATHITWLCMFIPRRGTEPIQIV